jgi:glycosyltransferase involved in cell wall biosynthesis
MRIVHVTDGYLPRVGGIERQVHDLAVGQQVYGHAVTVVTSAADVGDDPAATDVPVISPGRSGRPGSAIRYAWSHRGASHVLDQRPDLVHIHLSTFSPLGFLTARKASRAGLPTVVTVHSMWDYATPLFRAADLALGWRRWPVTWSAVSTAAAEPLQQLLGPQRPVTVLPNGIEQRAWQGEGAVGSAQHVTIVSVLRLARRKRPAALLAMLADLRQAVPAATRLEAVLIGGGTRRRALQRQLHRLDLADWVQLRGPATHDQIRQLYRRADVFVAPAKLESFGIAALEARCAGLPVVAQAKSGVRDFIRPGCNGLLADGDRDMVRALARLVEDPALRRRMQIYNQSTASPHDWSLVFGQCERLYRVAMTRVGEPGRTPFGGELAAASPQPAGWAAVAAS